MQVTGWLYMYITIHVILLTESSLGERERAR